MRLLAVLVPIACFAVGVWLATKVINPALRRRRRRLALIDRRQAELDDVLHRQQVTAAGMAWSDLQRHRERLEEELDRLHGRMPPPGPQH
jgi:hypothetical protein